MNLLRRVVLAAALTLSAPLLLPANAFAQPTDQVKEVARERFRDGVKAYDAQKWEEARAAFAQAYTLAGSPAVLLNLGLAEAKTGRCVDAGNHLQKFLREHREATAEQRSTASTTIEDCKKKAAVVALTVEPAGAEVTVDGVSVGKSPLLDPIFVEPGNRVLVASLNGKTSSTSVEAKKGQSTVARITLVTEPPLPPNPNPNPNPAPIINPAGPNPDPLRPPPVVPPGGPPIDKPDDGREDFGAWTLHSPIFWVGAGLFGLGLGLGIGFSAAAQSSKADAELIADQIRNNASADNVDGAPCGPEDGGGAGDVYPGDCNLLRDALGIHTANVAVAVTGWIVAVASAAGTVTYVMVDWYGGSKSKPKDAASHPWIMPLPLLSPEVQGASVVGTF